MVIRSEAIRLKDAFGQQRQQHVVLTHALEERRAFERLRPVVLTDAIADAQFMDMQAEVAINDVRSGAASGLPIMGGVDTRLGVDEFERSNEDFQRDSLINLQDGAYGIDGLADTVIIKGEVIPHSDIEGAYCLKSTTIRQ